ncbi:MAG TPA: hypothetical protein VKM55_14715 [Candidatus Lokiarchaeia archaeon]|nr:hypothetical protein [Candidatus Lokiarchaeia archaeon]
MLMQDSLLPAWFGFIFRLVSLLIAFAFLTISGISTLDKYRHIDREVDFEEKKDKYKGLPVPVIVVNAIVICLIGVLIASPFSSGDSPYIVYELISGCALCTLCMWMVIITSYKSTEHNKFRLLVISYSGFFVLLVLGLVVKGIMLGFIALFIIYIDIELNGATAWIAMDFDPEKEMRLVRMSLLSFAVLPLLAALAAFVTDPAMQIALSISGLTHALIAIYYSISFKETKVALTKSNVACLLIATSTSIFLPPNGLFVSSTALTMASMSSALIFILLVYAICLVFLLNILLKRKLDFKKGNRLKALVVYIILTLGLWGLFFLLRAGFVYQHDFLVQITICPLLWASLMLAVFQTIAMGALLSVALYDLPFIRALIEWFKKNVKVLCYTSLICFCALTVLVILFFVVPSIFGMYPILSIIALVALIAGGATLLASFYGRYEGTVYLIFLYIILGIVATLLFAPLSLGLIGLVALVVIVGILTFMIGKTMPFIVGIISFFLTLVLMYVRIANTPSNLGNATTAGIFEWFFALLFATNAIVCGLYFSSTKKGSAVVFVTGIIMLLLGYPIVFMFPTKDSIALSSCWLVSSIFLLLPVMFDFFRYFWNALHQDKWSSVIVSFLASGIVMITSGTKFTPGMSDFANASLSICLALGLLVGYYACTFKMMKAYKQRKLEVQIPARVMPEDDMETVRACNTCKQYVLALKGYKYIRVVKLFDATHRGHMLATLTYGDVKNDFTSKTEEYLEKLG